ncbi:hypothetical protein F0562_008536 [Nyssa sinensis]|uniref:RING-CH-type domain-containing protein n=1 Tax=Nyssa sinensis TaxID=561372 RepID=A0A5J5AAC7_9ASTE|nr:hypothetical protein F0562_008536 [Nyssa sinensis]
MESEIHGGQEGNENSRKPIGGVESEPVIAMKSEDTEIVSEEDGNSRTKTNNLERCGVSGEEGKGKEAEPEKNDCVVDVERSGGSLSGESLTGEKVCRICHLSSEHITESSDFIQLGCGCKNELGISHRRCAETWFRHRGNRQCEICGMTARNIAAIEDNRFLVEWHEMRMMAASAANSRREGSCLCKKNFCNFLMACLVLAFIFSWFFRVHMI